ncbi:MAG: S-adenosyl-methyltransferase [Cryomorphaceae bacterium]|nr:S-adenosyl-methyltransferase [Cryomorphaceae bacterium]
MESQSPKSRNIAGNILSGSFLLDVRMRKYWPMMLYLALLAGISIYSGHLVEIKIHQTQRLRTEMKELNSQYIDTRSRLMKESARSKVVFRAAALELIESPNPPKKIIIERKELDKK